MTLVTNISIAIGPPIAITLLEKAGEVAGQKLAQYLIESEKKVSMEINSSDVSKALLIIAKVITPTMVLQTMGEVVGKTLAHYFIEAQKNFSITGHLISGFPEDWQADLESQKERWIKQKYPSQTIRYFILKHLLHMIWVYIQIKIENIWLPKSASTKEIK
jgi:hypothetical protein